MERTLSCEPRVDILKRSNQLDMILEGILSRVQNERIRLRTAYNASSRINQLPAEILSGIFLLHLNQLSESREISLRNLAVVCSAWKDLVLRSPFLWTVLDARCQSSRDFLIASVSRSKGLPLTVNTTESWLSPNNRPLLRSFAPRIQSLSYTGAYHDMIEVYLPTLRDLHVVHEDKADGNGMEDGDPDLAIRVGVPFRSLSLNGVTLTSCDWDRLKHLEVLHLVDLSFYEPSFTTPFLHALAASTKLQTLVVDGVWLSDTSKEVPITDIPNLHFPILHTISVKGSMGSISWRFPPHNVAALYWKDWACQGTWRGIGFSERCKADFDMPQS